MQVWQFLINLFVFYFNIGHMLEVSMRMFYCQCWFLPVMRVVDTKFAIVSCSK